MNLYFLFEGKTERFFYTRFLDYFFGQRLQAVEFADAAQANQYYLVSSAGYPFILYIPAPGVAVQVMLRLRTPFWT